MAIIERPSTVPAIAGGDVPQFVTPASSYGVFRRPVTTTGWRSWLFTVDHKKIGIMYGAAALFFLIIGGSEALLIRAQLWAPRGTLLSAASDPRSPLFEAWVSVAQAAGEQPEAR